MVSANTSRVAASIAVFAVAILAVAASGYSDSCEEAFHTCDFRFEGKNGLPTFPIDGKADKAFTPRIVSTVYHETLGVLNTNNIVPEFILGGYNAEITKFGSQKFTPTAFKPFSIPYTPWSGIGHETFHGDQLKVAKGKCIRVYFTHYQLLSQDKYGKYVVKENRNDVPKYENKCVVFRAGH